MPCTFILPFTPTKSPVNSNIRDMDSSISVLSAGLCLLSSSQSDPPPPCPPSSRESHVQKGRRWEPLNFTYSPLHHPHLSIVHPQSLLAESRWSPEVLASFPPGCNPLFVSEHRVKEYTKTSGPVDPILVPNPNRFVLFPIKHLDVWNMYKKAEASFWTAEEIDLAHDLKVSPPYSECAQRSLCVIFLLT
jgi:hypothetical protein